MTKNEFSKLYLSGDATKGVEKFNIPTGAPVVYEVTMLQFDRVGKLPLTHSAMILHNSRRKISIELPTMKNSEKLYDSKIVQIEWSRYISTATSFSSIDFFLSSMVTTHWLFLDIDILSIHFSLQQFELNSIKENLDN